MKTYILELVVTHSVLILAYWLFLRQENQYHKMRLFLLWATFLALITPLFRLPKLFDNQQLPIHDFAVGTITMTGPSVVRSVPETSILTFDNMMYCSLLISLGLLIKLISKIIFLIRLKRKSICENYNGFRVRRVSDVSGSFTFFNWIFLSEEIDQNRKEYAAILKHEQAHANLKHSYDLIFFELYKVFFWWLPSSWYINKEIKRIHEYQADAYALRTFNLELYSSILIKTTLQSNGLNIVSSFHDGLIFKRLKAMKQQAKKVNPWKSGMLTTLCASLFLIFACSEDRGSLIAQSSQTDKSEEKREVFTKVEEQPTYEGGMHAFYKYVLSEIRYPVAARKSNTEGTVDVQFVIERDGSLSNVKALNSIGAGCDEEAVRVVQNASGFKAGSQRGRTVRVAMVMPITFKLHAEKRNPDETALGTIIMGEVSTSEKELDIDAVYKSGSWSGIIKSWEGDELPGVNIVVKGTSYGTVSDLDGTFSVEATADQELHISFVGYKSAVLKK